LIGLDRKWLAEAKTALFDPERKSDEHFNLRRAVCQCTTPPALARAAGDGLSHSTTEIDLRAQYHRDPSMRMREIRQCAIVVSHRDLGPNHGVRCCVSV
jgi:hypothetical protein